jgi:hypothetical protein
MFNFYDMIVVVAVVISCTKPFRGPQSATAMVDQLFNLVDVIDPWYGWKGYKYNGSKRPVLERNKSTIQFYRYVHGISNLAYLVLRFLFFGSSLTTEFMLLYGLAVFFSTAAVFEIAHMGRVDENGRYISDLNWPGHISCGFRNILLLSPIVYALSIISDYVLLAVPVFCLTEVYLEFI